MRANVIRTWFCFSLLICCLWTVRTLRADTAADLLQLADAYDHATLVSRLQEVPPEERGDAVVIYCQALLEEDGEQANNLYHKALIAENNDRIADRAMWRIAQYYYARGYYVRARAYLRRMVIDYPASVDMGRARQLLAVLDKAGIEDQVVPQAEGLPSMPQRQRSAGAPEQRNPGPRDAPIRTTPPPVTTPVPDAPPLTSAGQSRYAVQLAFFTSEKNAYKLVDRLKALNYRDARVVPKFLLGRRGYFVWVGEFDSEADARRMGEAMRIKGYTETFVIKEIP